MSGQLHVDRLYFRATRSHIFGRNYDPEFQRPSADAYNMGQEVLKRVVQSVRKIK